MTYHSVYSWRARCVTRVRSLAAMVRKAPEERREQILVAARRLFAEHGYQATNIADIAADLRLGHGTFYRYFKSKRDIFEKVLEDVIGRIAHLASAEGEASSVAGYRAKIERVCVRLLELFREDPAAGRLLFYESLGVDREMTTKIEHAFDLFAQFTEHDLRIGKQKGFLPKDLDVHTTAYALNAMTFEGIRRCLRSEEPAQEAERWMRAAVRVALHGIT